MPADRYPFAALGHAVERQAWEEQAAQAVKIARSKLILGRRPQDAFFATLALRLHAEPDWDCLTAATDGIALVYNPHWFADLTVEDAQGVIAHEIMHCALAHHARRQHRDPERWNVAADLSINPLLVDAGYTLPTGRLMPGEGLFAALPRGKSAEEYYALMPSPPPGSSEEPTSCPDPGACGSVREPRDVSPAAIRRAEADWQVAVLQARYVAQQRGELPGALDRLVNRILEPAVDWRQVLRAFLSRQARNDYSWFPPNRRLIHAGLYLPGLRSEELGEVVLAVDTSASIGQAELDRFATEAQAILDAYDCQLRILYHDSRVRRVEAWQPGDGPLQLHPLGGGGTDHRPVFAHIEREGWNPTCLVCLTDLESCFPDTAPAYPVLWAVVGGRGVHPFGTRVELP